MGVARFAYREGDRPTFPLWHVGLSRVDDLVCQQYSGSGPIHGRNGTKNR